jgi:HEAT repeats
MYAPPPMKTPTALEFLEFFCVEPSLSGPDDRDHCYQISDSQGTVLRFYFNAIAGSVEFVVESAGRERTRICQEGAFLIRLDDNGKIHVECRSAEWMSTIDVQTKPELVVCASSLVQPHQPCRNSVRAQPAIKQLIDVLQNDESDVVRQRIVRALGHLGYGRQDVQQALEASLNDWSPEVRKAAAVAIQALQQDYYAPDWDGVMEQ